MQRKTWIACLFLICLGLGCRMATAQEVVHALTGTVSAIDPSAKTITVFLDGGSNNLFSDETDTKARLFVDKKLLSDSTAADDFKKEGAYVIVFYFGGRDTRTAVALRSLGKGPFTATEGKVEKYQRDQSITVEDQTGAQETYKITPQTVAEAGEGAVDGTKIQAQKGDHVRVVGTTASGSPIALFLRED